MYKIKFILCTGWEVVKFTKLGNTINIPFCIYIQLVNAVYTSVTKKQKPCVYISNTDVYTRARA